MRAAVFRHSYEPLSIEDVSLPPVGAHDVKVKIITCSICHTDMQFIDQGMAPNMKPPIILGHEIAGIIEETGADVKKFKAGDRVVLPATITCNSCLACKSWNETHCENIKRIGIDINGGFAEYTRVAARHAYPVESNLSDLELASFPCSYSTAENMLTRAAVKSGETVLVTGASGGVGSAAVQLALARGARVLAVTSAGKAGKLKALGADQTLDRNADYLSALGAEQVDVVIDLVAGPKWPSLLDVLRPGGRYAVAGAIAGPLVELDVRTLYLKDLSFFGCTVLEPDVFGNLIRRIERADIAPLVAETYPLREIGAAQQAFAEEGYIGKIVLNLT